MFERFTDRARRVMALANQEAQRYNHEHIGTEHILLGLLKEGNNPAATVLKNHRINLKRLRSEFEKVAKARPDLVAMGKLPQTPKAKKVIEYTFEETRSLGHYWIGCGHIFLGLLHETEGLHNRVFKKLNLNVDNIREELLTELLKSDWSKDAFESNRFSVERKELHEQFRHYVNCAPLTLLIDPGDATARELGELFFELSLLYRMAGGSGINFTIIDAKEPAIA